MRGIKFRGLEIGSHKWVYGDLTSSFMYNRSKFCIHPQRQGEALRKGKEVYSYSIGQFTGFKDRNGKMIFNGDILSDYTDTDEGVIKSHQQVYWNENKGAWCLDNTYRQDKSDGDLLSEILNEFEYEISGNIYENPELLKEEA